MKTDVKCVILYRFKSELNFDHSIRCIGASALPVYKMKELLSEKHGFTANGDHLLITHAHEKVLCFDNEVLVSGSRVVVTRVPKLIGDSSDNDIICKLMKCLSIKNTPNEAEVPRESSVGGKGNPIPAPKTAGTSHAGPTSEEARDNHGFIAAQNRQFTETEKRHKRRNKKSKAGGDVRDTVPVQQTATHSSSAAGRYYDNRIAHSMASMYSSRPPPLTANAPRWFTEMYAGSVPSRYVQSQAEQLQLTAYLDELLRQAVLKHPAVESHARMQPVASPAVQEPVHHPQTSSATVCNSPSQDKARQLETCKDEEARIDSMIQQCAKNYASMDTTDMRRVGSGTCVRYDTCGRYDRDGVRNLNVVRSTLACDDTRCSVSYNDFTCTVTIHGSVNIDISDDDDSVEEFDEQPQGTKVIFGRVASMHDLECSIGEDVTSEVSSSSSAHNTPLGITASDQPITTEHLSKDDVCVKLELDGEKEPEADSNAEKVVRDEVISIGTTKDMATQTCELLEQMEAFGAMQISGRVNIPCSQPLNFHDMHRQQLPMSPPDIGPYQPEVLVHVHPQQFVQMPTECPRDGDCYPYDSPPLAYHPVRLSPPHTPVRYISPPHDPYRMSPYHVYQGSPQHGGGGVVVGMPYYQSTQGLYQNKTPPNEHDLVNHGGSPHHHTPPVISRRRNMSRPHYPQGSHVIQSQLQQQHRGGQRLNSGSINGPYVSSPVNGLPQMSMPGYVIGKSVVGYQAVPFHPVWPCSRIIPSND